MSVPGKSRPTMFRSGSTWIWSANRAALFLQFLKSSAQPSAPLKPSILAALHPVLEHLQRHRAVVLGRLGDRRVVALLDPGFVRRGAVARQRQPHQPAGGLTRQLVAVEQHLAEQRLRLVLALLSGQTEPARAIAEIVPRRADTLQIEPGQ